MKDSTRMATYDGASKDLEKDEREWTLEGLDGFGELEGYRGPRVGAGEEVVVVPKARLQQVETEHAEELSAEIALNVKRLEQAEKAEEERDEANRREQDACRNEQEIELEWDKTTAQLAELHRRIFDAAPVCSTINSALAGLKFTAKEYSKIQSELLAAREIISEKDLIIRANERHTQYWEDKCAE